MVLCGCMAGLLFTTSTATTYAASTSTHKANTCALDAQVFGTGARWTIGSSNITISSWSTCKGNTELLAYQRDGNLVLYCNTNVGQISIWASNTNSETPNYVAFQTDGNFVVYSKDIWGSTYAGWSSGTYNKGANALIMQRDGNVVIYQGADGTGPLWATNTYGRC